MKKEAIEWWDRRRKEPTSTYFLGCVVGLVLGYMFGMW